MNCTRAPGSFSLPDPLGGTRCSDETRARPAGRADRTPLPYRSRTDAPDRRSTPPTETQTTGCDIAGNGNAADGTHWLLSPGLYPAGLDIDNDATVYLLPGIYWIGGGGFEVDGRASVFSVSSLADAQAMYANRNNATQLRGTIFDAGGGGVMIYNSKLPD